LEKDYNSKAVSLSAFKIASKSCLLALPRTISIRLVKRNPPSCVISPLGKYPNLASRSPLLIAAVADEMATVAMREVCLRTKPI